MSDLLDRCAEAQDLMDFVLASQDPRPECREAARRRIALAVLRVALKEPASDKVRAAFEGVKYDIARVTGFGYDTGPYMEWESNGADDAWSAMSTALLFSLERA